MHYRSDARDPRLTHNPIKALVTPRPIGWIGALSAKGELNLSPYSFFNLVSDNPDMVAFSSAGRKDAVTFIEETGEFTCSLATHALRDAMNATSASLPRGQSEFEAAGLAQAPSLVVKPPRVRDAPAALECVWTQTVPVRPLEGDASYFLVIGQVVAVYIDDRFVTDGKVRSADLGIISRGGYHDYARLTEVFSLTRPG